jgi:hypothetical protein
MDEEVLKRGTVQNRDRAIAHFAGYLEKIENK